MTINADKHPTTGSIAFEELDTVFFPKIKDPDAIAKIIQRTRSWTADNLFLTQLIYRYVRQYSAQIIRAEGPNNIVDEIVHQKILKNWQTNEAATLLCRIEQTLHNFDCQDTLIVLYLQILWRKGLAANAQPKLIAEQTALLHSELVTLTQGRLQLSNRIYATVFGMDWIEQQRPGLTTRTVLTPTTVLTPKVDETSPAESHHKESAKLPPISNTNLKDVDQNNTALITAESLVYVRKVAQPLKVVKTLFTVTLLASGAALLGVLMLQYFQAPRGLGATAQPLSQNTQTQNTQTQNTQTQNQPTAILTSNLQTSNLQTSNLQTSNLQTSNLQTSNLQQNLESNIPQTSDPKAFFDQGITHATNGRWLPMVQQFCSIPPTSAYFAPAKNQLERWITLYPQNIQQANSTFLATKNASCNLLEDTLKSVK